MSREQKRRDYSETINSILATDCGSTTSKARFFKRVGTEYRFIAAGEAPTTVETPYEDVTLGVRNAVKEIEERTHHKLLSPEGIITPSEGDMVGVDLFVTTSSAGGGLQMQVTGITKNITAESAERAALGAGAIVMDVLSIDDGRRTWDKIDRMRFLRPDMILFSGGVDGGAFEEVVQIAEIIRAAEPKHRLGALYALPIVYAGNKDVQAKVKEILEDKFVLKFADNLRPEPEVENLTPARDMIHEQFMEHVMAHAPGYDKLMKWTPVPIMPTPIGEGTMFRIFAEAHHANLIGVGLGGATTNVYSVFEGKFVRSVSANLGMSYSICNVLKETGLKNIIRWIPCKIEEEDIRDKLRNKMIRPTTIPQSLDQLLIEHAVAREALRIACQHHKFLARPIIGTRDYSTMLEVSSARDTYLDMLKVDWVGGTGGLLSHAPRRIQSTLILIDGVQVEGVTSLFQDSVFMMPHLGVLSTVHPESALEIFERDCLVRLGTCLTFRRELKGGTIGEKVGTLTLTMPNGEILREEPTYGTIRRIPLQEGETAQIEVKANRGFQVTQGGAFPKLRSTISITVEGGEAGIIIDARGRPIWFPEDEETRRALVKEWFVALDMYPRELLDNL
ncbi:MAG: glutamate mutase L [Candidatus Bathyarchaeota archaeon]